ncbi:MAG: ribosome silencing factor [Phycisphaerales bacterium]|nr:ribosome silencing factor [Phycisphaerae bacterium]MCH2153063.1 ribosome silencing factor [Phycisphaerales bacterium]
MTNADQEQRGGGKKSSHDVMTFAIAAARLASDLRCGDVKLLDVRDVSQICDVILIASGTSDRQMRSVADELETLGKGAGYQRFRATSDALDTWIVVDFVEVVVHLFEPGRRDYYDLETLWSDAEEVDFARPEASGQQADASTAE